MVTKTLRREFLQLADTYNPAKNKIAGFYISEKLDGTRCFWDGGITRGMKTSDVPWASLIDPKTGQPKKKVKSLSTGLWSRYGNPIMAPDAFLNALPACPLDGELWAGRGNFQLCRSICGGDEADSRFDKISYAVYSSPALTHIFATGEIKNANMVLKTDMEDIAKFVKRRVKAFGGDFKSAKENSTFEDELLFLREVIESENDRCFLHRQSKLPNDEASARETADVCVSNVLDKGGEGLIIRDPSSIWTPKRHKGLLKFKPFEDAEAEVIGYICGKEGKQGNVLGKIGALVVRTTSLKNNVEFEIGSGLTFEDREFATDLGAKVAARIPGQKMPSGYDGKHIKIGQTVTFKYRELSDDNIPKEGRYWRKREGTE